MSNLIFPKEKFCFYSSCIFKYLHVLSPSKKHVHSNSWSHQPSFVFFILYPKSSNYTSLTSPYIPLKHHTVLSSEILSCLVTDPALILVSFSYICLYLEFYFTILKDSFTESCWDNTERSQISFFPVVLSDITIVQ